MNIVVLVKHAFVSEFRPGIRADGKALEKKKLVYEMNDWVRALVKCCGNSFQHVLR
jgi:electron transfer flavoprotein alpha/beta subunit